jgi:SAM-dependent methyltransferase
MSTELPASHATALAYDRIAGVYDTQVQGGQWMRAVLWASYRRLFRPGQWVLDLSCGTGIDTLYLAQQGVHVVGIDISPSMIEQLQIKAERLGLSDRVQAYVHDVGDLPSWTLDKLALPQTREVRAHDVLRQAQDDHDEPIALRQAQDDYRKPVALRQAQGDHGEPVEPPPFDGIISAFAGLSSLPDLASVANEAARLLKPGGIFVAHMLSRGNVWVRLDRVRRGQWGKALSGGEHTMSVVIGGIPVRHYLYYPGEAYRYFFAPHFKLRRAYSLGSVRPPNAPRRLPSGCLGLLGSLERLMAGRYPFVNWGQFFVLEMEKRE